MLLQQSIQQSTQQSTELGDYLAHEENESQRSTRSNEPAEHLKQ
jgi:hypothetical protein